MLLHERRLEEFLAAHELTLPAFQIISIVSDVNGTASGIISQTAGAVRNGIFIKEDVKSTDYTRETYEDALVTLLGRHILQVCTDDVVRDMHVFTSLYPADTSMCELPGPGDIALTLLGAAMWTAIESAVFDRNIEECTTIVTERIVGDGILRVTVYSTHRTPVLIGFTVPDDCEITEIGAWRRVWYRYHEKGFRLQWSIPL